MGLGEALLHQPVGLAARGHGLSVEEACDGLRRRKRRRRGKRRAEHDLVCMCTCMCMHMN